MLRKNLIMSHVYKRFTVSDTDEIESAFQNISLKDERKGKIGKKSSKEQNPILKDTTVDSIVDYIQRGDCKNIVLMVGAGISTCKFMIMYKYDLQI